MTVVPYSTIMDLFMTWIYEQVRKQEGPVCVHSRMKMGAASTSPTTTIADSLREVVHHSMTSTFREKGSVPHHHQCWVSLSTAVTFSIVISTNIFLRHLPCGGVSPDRNLPSLSILI